MPRNKIAFSYHGGKYSHLKWLLPLLPTADDGVTCYCEPCGGSMAVLLNREPCPVEVYNDAYGEVVHFFRMLRDHPQDLIELLYMTPYAREEYYDTAPNMEDSPLADIERARRFFVRARQAFGAVILSPGCGWGTNRTTYSRGMAERVSKWWSAIDKLEDISVRLLRVQIEHLDALDVIARYDSPNTLFYCDPPYVVSTLTSCGYGDFMYTDKDHERLARALRDISGLVAISGYRCALMDTLYKGWQRHTANVTSAQSTRRAGKSGKQRVECLWTNYDYK